MSQLLTVFKIKFTLQYPGRFPLTSHHAYLFFTRYILAILAFVKVFQCSMLFSPSRTFYMFFPSAVDPKFVSLPKYVCQNLNLSATVYRGWSLHEGDWCSYRPESSLEHSKLWGHGKKTAVCIPEEGPRQSPIILAPYSQTSSLQNCQK